MRSFLDMGNPYQHALGVSIVRVTLARLRCRGGGTARELFNPTGRWRLALLSVVAKHGLWPESKRAQPVKTALVGPLKALAPTGKSAGADLWRKSQRRAAGC